MGLLLGLNGCKLSDLRTDNMRNEMLAAGAKQKARTLMQDAYIAHHAAQWEKFETFEVDFQEKFYRLKFASAFPKGEARVKLEFVPDTYDGRLTFMDGKKAGEQWGLTDWASWKRKKGKNIKWKHSKRTKFWLPTYQYFIQFPVKILEANYWRYAGKRTIDGWACDVLFASWNSAEPQRDMDQYLIYVDQKTKLIRALEYTVRGAGGWLRGACIYKNYMEVEGVLVPGVMKVLGPKVELNNQQIFHQMEVKGMRINVVPASEIRLKRE